jgi:hypothetical protein
MLILGHEKQEINDINFFINATNLVLLFSAPLFNIYCTFIQYSSNTKDPFITFSVAFSELNLSCPGSDFGKSTDKNSPAFLSQSIFRGRYFAWGRWNLKLLTQQIDHYFARLIRLRTKQA